MAALGVGRHPGTDGLSGCVVTTRLSQPLLLKDVGKQDR